MPARKTARRRRSAPASPDEPERLIGALETIAGAAGIDAITQATYVLLDRIIARMSAEGADEPDAFLKLVKAHNETTGRIAQLAHARRMISDDATDRIASALDDLAQQLKLDV